MAATISTKEAHNAVSTAPTKIIYSVGIFIGGVCTISGNSVNFGSGDSILFRSMEEFTRMDIRMQKLCPFSKDGKLYFITHMENIVNSDNISGPFLLISNDDKYTIAPQITRENYNSLVDKFGHIDIACTHCKKCLSERPSSAICYNDAFYCNMDCAVFKNRSVYPDKAIFARGNLLVYLLYKKYNLSEYCI